jgi:hypothetical protein
VVDEGVYEVDEIIESIEVWEEVAVVESDLWEVVESANVWKVDACEIVINSPHMQF